MKKRIVIAGCRNYTNYEEAEKYIDFCVSKLCKQHTLIILSGGCRGADALGEQYAIAHGYAIERYPADWATLG